MSIGIWQIIIFLVVVLIYLVPVALCLILIKKKPYKIPSSKKFAGFWARLGAGIIDLIILIIASLILSLLGPIGLFLDIIVGWLYFVLLQSSEHRSTFGMRALGIKIHDEQMNKVGFWRLTGRYFATWVSGIILFAGFFAIAFTQRKQGLHDMIARTIHTKD